MRGMRMSSKLSGFCVLISLLALTDCSKKPDVKASVSDLEKAFPSATVAPTQAVQPEQAPSGSRSPDDANACVRAALSAARGSVAILCPS